MKILFTHSYFLHLDPKQLKAGKPYAPLATLYAMAFLRQHGYQVALADLQFSSPTQLNEHIQLFQPDVLVIYDDAFNYLVKMCLTNMRQATFEMLSIAKSLSLPVIVSSSDATDHRFEYLNKGADYLIIGEGEFTLKELLDHLNIKAQTVHIDGISYLNQGKVISTKPREVCRHLDEIPMPAWDLIDLEPYKTMWKKSAGFFSLNMVTTRGCPYKCNWCAKPVYGNRYNSHSAERVAEEMFFLVHNKDVEHIWFADDIFGLKPGFLENLVKALKQLNLSVPFKIQSRADLLLNNNALELLKEAGCSEIWIGAESGSQTILDAMDKGISIAQIESARKKAKQYGIKLAFFMQFGYTGESMADINKSILLLDRLMPDDIGVSVSYPLPGTVFYNRVKEQLSAKTNWKDSDDLDLMVDGAFSKAFYRDLQRYVHFRYRSKQAYGTLKSKLLSRAALLLPYYSIRKKFFHRKLNRIAGGELI